MTASMVHRMLSNGTRCAGRAGALLTLVVLLSACGRTGMDDLTSYIGEVKGRRGVPIEPLPQLKPYEAFVYQAFELRDPFSVTTSGEGTGGGVESMGSGSGVSPDFKRPKEVTERFPLDSLRMVGSLTRDGELWGLVRDPSGTLHRVQPGNYLGQNYGRIIRVTEERIDLVEIVQDGLGGWMERQASIALSERDFGG